MLTSNIPSAPPFFYTGKRNKIIFCLCFWSRDDGQSGCGSRHALRNDFGLDVVAPRNPGVIPRQLEVCPLPGAEEVNNSSCSQRSQLERKRTR
jgi:hypothetical protein